MMIRSQKFVTSKHVELPFNQCNSIVIGLIRVVERGRNGIISLIKRSFIQAFVYFHLLYNVCYSMAKTENNQESSNSKTLLIDGTENVDDTAFPENESVTVKKGCQHIPKAVDTNNVRKNVVRHRSFATLKCSPCKAQSLSETNEENLFLCLKCGACNCEEHAIHHYKSPHSDKHNLAAKLSDWTVWCFICNVEVPTDINGKLKEGILVLKKEHSKASQVVQYKHLMTTTEPDVTVTPRIMESTAHCSRSHDTSSSLSITVGQKSTSVLPFARGLVNVGNTCFFNSVLQCLAQTPFLIEILLEISEPGQKAELPLNNSPPLTMELEKWGKVTEALAITLRQVTQVSGDAYNPITLFNHLREKYRQFKGYNQHDAHELLRQLLDSVKTEDLRRYQTHILKYFGVSKMNPAEVDERKKTAAKELNQKLTEIVNIRPDPVFKGTLISTHQCMKCHHQSSVVESFLDLSLPVTFSKSQNIIPRKSVDMSERPKSKHQKKKERKAARKAIKLARYKKRLKDEGKKNEESSVIEMKDISESGYSSSKATSPEQSENHLLYERNGKEILAEALSEIDSTSPISIKEDSETSKSINSEINAICIENYENSNCEKFDKIDAINSSSSEGSSTNKVDSELSHSVTPELRFRLLSPLPNQPRMDRNSSCSSSSDNEKDEDELDYAAEDEIIDDDDDDDVSDNENQLDDTDMQNNGFCATLQPSSEYEENSIQACLSEFTACEILSGSNSLKCESCTERQSKITGEKKPVYQPITKQLLIKYPPPVLILHLKRFEMRSAFSFSPAALRKADKTISFPLILDIGSFCSINCENLLIPNQKKILYSLYGVVEHSGSLNAGHYVAYVKVRKLVEKNSYRRLFLPKSKTNEFEPLNIDDLEQKLREHKYSEKQWYYISDSLVRPISEEEVLHKQAYLLFYERIL